MEAICQQALGNGCEGGQITLTALLKTDLYCSGGSDTALLDSGGTFVTGKLGASDRFETVLIFSTEQNATT